MCGLPSRRRRGLPEALTWRSHGRLLSGALADLGNQGCDAGCCCTTFTFCFPCGRARAPRCLSCPYVQRLPLRPATAPSDGCTLAVHAVLSTRSALVPFFALVASNHCSQCLSHSNTALYQTVQTRLDNSPSLYFSPRTVYTGRLNCQAAEGSPVRAMRASAAGEPPAAERSAAARAD
eukprot:COSAG03_NODE_3214_length_2142_cov_1.899168_2_plen_178_part_00